MAKFGRWVNKLGRWVSKRHYLDISQKYKMGDISNGVAIKL
jgi:hypothetical protein